MREAVKQRIESTKGIEDQLGFKQILAIICGAAYKAKLGLQKTSPEVLKVLKQRDSKP